MKTKDSKIVITGGGSGGHTVTALSVIEELLEKDESIREKLLFVGGKKGMEGEKRSTSIEERMARGKDISFIGIRSGKLQRRFAFSTLFGLMGVVGGIVDAFGVFRKYDVSAVFSTGGYVTVPVCFVAWLRRVPIVIHEQTTRVGLSNRISSKFARRVLIGFPDAEDYFPRKKVRFTGNTVRKELLDTSFWPKGLRAKLRKFKKSAKDYPVILIAGGGQGSHLMNTTVFIALKSLVSHFQVILITGENEVYRDHEKLVNATKKLSKEHQRRIIITKFAKAEELGVYFDAADVFVGRSGALFTYEVGALGIPAVLIPIPWVTHNEQYHNAKVLEEIGLANILSEGVLSPEILFQEVQRMITREKSGLLRPDEEARKKIFVTDGAKRIVKELEEVGII